MNVTIEKIEINSFGKLKNAFLSLDSGINLMSAPNESGKSTLAAFIKFVFYGFTGARMQSVSDNERKLYTPWDGEVSEGSITLTADGTRYTVHRRCLASGKDTVEVTNRATGRHELIGEVPGEVFFGVTEEVFARTLFFRQLTAPQSKDEILAERLRNIAISADEQVGTKKAVSELNAAKNELKSRMGNGLIPKAEKERDALEEAITASCDTRRDAEALNGEIEKRSKTLDTAEKKLKALKAERKNIEKYASFLKLQAINRLKLEERNAREEYEAASAGLKKRDDGSFGELFAKNTEYVAECRDCENASQALELATAERDALLNERRIGIAEAKDAERVINGSRRISNVLFIIAAIALVAGVITTLASPETMGLGIIIAVAGVVLAAVGAVVLGKPAGIAREAGFESVAELKDAITRLPSLEKQLNDAEMRVNALEDELGESKTRCAILKRELDSGINGYIELSDANYSEQLQLILSLSAESGEKLAVWRAKKEELDNASEGFDVKALEEEAEGATEPERERAKVDRELAFYTSQFEQLSELNRRDELTLATLEARSGDPALMIGKRDSLNARIDELNIKHRAYETAIAVIEESADYMKSMVAPRIGERADEYFTAATGGKYRGLEIDTRLSMSFGDDMRRSCEYLSAGTRDSAYLSLRLALADMLFGGCGVPIILDDAFGRIDDNRLRMISGAINEAAKKHQIILLAHGDREAGALDDIGAKYNEFNIEKL